MFQSTYEQNERRLFNRQLQDVERAPLSDRKEAAAAWQNALVNEPEIVAERIGWILNGSYGYGSYQAAREVLHNKRMNRRAWFGQTVAALEWQCPGNYARSAWNKLNGAQQARLNALIDQEMAEAESEE